MALIDKLTAIADAIRGKTGKTEEMTLDQMATEIAGIQAGGGGNDNAIALGLLDGTLTEYESEELTILRQNAFYGHPSITRVVLPNLTSPSNVMGSGVPGGSLRECTNLEFVDIGPNCFYIQGNSMRGSTALKTVVLRHKDNPVALGQANAFQSTPFYSGGTGGTVYVPAALIEDYKVATNWATLYSYGTCNFVAIEGSEYE